MTAPTVEVSSVAASAGSSAASARAAQAAVSAAAMRDAVKLWPLLDPKRLSETWPGWLRAMILLTKSYHVQSSAAAGRSYLLMRAQATQSPAPSRLVKIAEPPTDEWMARAYGFAGPGQLTRDVARPNTALSTTLGTTARIVQDGGRTTTIGTIHADPVAVGWYRLTDGRPCAFCALLASRGITYKSEKAAGFQSHNDCGCSAAPAFTRDQPLPDLSEVADRIYTEKAAGAGTGKQLAAFRKAWAEHQAQN